MDLKEIKINFKKVENSKTNFNMPTGKYELKYITNENNMNKKDDFILSEGDKFLILKFDWTDDEGNKDIMDEIASMTNTKSKKMFKILKFIIGVEYLRTEPIDIEYEMEIKFRIN